MIPRSFKLMGLTITVTPCELEDAGRWNFQEQRIRIDKSLSDEGKLQAFWHEAFHACLEAMSYDKYSKDEAFVDRIAHCLAQIERTRKP